MVSELMSLNGLIYMYKIIKHATSTNNNNNSDDTHCCKSLRNGEHELMGHLFLRHS